MDLQNAALFRLIFENASNGVLLVDEKLICLDANPALSQMVGRARTSLLGHSCRDLVSFSDRRSLDVGARQLWEKGSWQGELKMAGSDACERSVEWKVSTQENDSIALAVLTDITARRQHEYALAAARNTAQRSQSRAEEANRSKDYFLAMVGHEIRSPLGGSVRSRSRLATAARQ